MKIKNVGESTVYLGENSIAIKPGAAVEVEPPFTVTASDDVGLVRVEYT